MAIENQENDLPIYFSNNVWIIEVTKYIFLDSILRNVIPICLYVKENIF